jgi:hypothetical protein
MRKPPHPVCATRPLSEKKNKKATSNKVAFSIANEKVRA